MAEQASFEPRAVLAPRRRRLARLVLLLPVVALVATAWLGASGARPDELTAEIADPTAAATPSPRPQVPAEVLGLDVKRLDEVERRDIRRDELVVVTGWYVATATTNCPTLAAIYREGSLPEVRGDADELVFCERFGVLYPSRPDVGERWPWVPVRLVVGVIVPPWLESIGAEATEVVFIGRLVEARQGCRAPSLCRELVVDHLAWTSPA
jgi:hypothetical protein